MLEDQPTGIHHPQQTAVVQNPWIENADLEGQANQENDMQEAQALLAEEDEESTEI